MIEDLLNLRKIAINTNLKQLSRGLQELQRARDAIAHGIWMSHPMHKDPMLQILKGKWSVPSKPKTKRIIEPEAIRVRINDLRSLTRSMDQALAVIRVLEHEITARLSAPPQESSGP